MPVARAPLPPPTSTVEVSSGGAPDEPGELPDAELRQAAIEGPWHRDEAAAVEAARRLHRPMLIDVTAEWCVPCKLLEADTLEDAAVEAARRLHRPMLIDVTAEWCVPCKLLEADTLEDAAVRTFLAEHFVALRIDVTEESRANREQQRRHRVRGLPTLLLLDPRGVELDRVESYLDARALLMKLESARARSGE